MQVYNSIWRLVLWYPSMGNHDAGRRPTLPFMGYSRTRESLNVASQRLQDGSSSGLSTARLLTYAPLLGRRSLPQAVFYGHSRRVGCSHGSGVRLSRFELPGRHQCGHQWHNIITEFFSGAFPQISTSRCVRDPHRQIYFNGQHLLPRHHDCGLSP